MGDEMPRYAVFLEVDDHYVVVSCGDSEFECELWLNDHPDFKELPVFIGCQYIDSL